MWVCRAEQEALGGSGGQPPVGSAALQLTPVLQQIQDQLLCRRHLMVGGVFGFTFVCFFLPEDRRATRMSIWDLTEVTILPQEVPIERSVKAFSSKQETFKWVSAATGTETAKQVSSRRTTTQIGSDTQTSWNRIPKPSAGRADFLSHRLH